MNNPSKMAGEFAAKIKAKKLILTHFSMRYQIYAESELSVKDLVQEAQKACGEATQVVAAEDLLKIEL